MSADHLQRIAYEWGIATFGFEHMIDKKVRATRMVEEAVETAQTLGVPQEQLHKLIDAVYQRPPGDLTEELGGTALTLAVLCKACGHDFEAIMLREICRVINKPRDEMAKRNQEKLAMGLTG